MLRAYSTVFVSFIDIELPWSKTATNSRARHCALFFFLVGGDDGVGRSRQKRKADCTVGSGRADTSTKAKGFDPK